MNNWSLHWLEASGDLGSHRAEIVKNFEAAYRSISGLLPAPRLDVLIQRLVGATIPEMGIVGRAYSSTLFAMTVDPDNPNFSNSLVEGALHRQIVHEVHHCMRMAGPGYGWTLGEALVSEGLAGRFVHKLLDTPPEPWERAMSRERLLHAPVELNVLKSSEYDHEAWFFGGDTHPRWHGYTLGYEIAACWQENAGEIDAATWINVPAETVIEAAVKGGLVAEHR
ncbi:DUF2268 domain-containing protein [Martelella mediterranea]|uniref:DUF2268 domain-containing putative Zn-dependent protease n=1 Tax=Martelella mediterranea TaxID=293089 RepID=UPI001E3EE4BD|nr:DUF2268 domain-containing putative Zn-dependent protease [Martelella mediterranea]MCD1634903.1 DUF2268 domain-containing protein [Martelella mediterranea]